MPAKEISEPAKKLIDVLQAWYELMEGELTDLIEPDFDGRRPLFTKDEVNDMVRIIDHEFELELHYSRDYWKELGLIEPPRFSRLGGKARLAFVQDLWAVLHDVDLPVVPDAVEAWRTTVYNTSQTRTTPPSTRTPGAWGAPL